MLVTKRYPRPAIIIPHSLISTLDCCFPVVQLPGLEQPSKEKRGRETRREWEGAPVWSLSCACLSVSLGDCPCLLTVCMHVVCVYLSAFVPALLVVRWSLRACVHTRPHCYYSVP